MRTLLISFFVVLLILAATLIEIWARAEVQAMREAPRTTIIARIGDMQILQKPNGQVVWRQL